MKYTQKREKNTLKITFKATAEEWAAFDKRAYEQNKGKYNVPGFRKGHVPKNVLENRYGKGLFFEDALYICAQEYYNEFLDKNKEVEIVSRPTLDEKAFKVDEKGITFAVVVTVRPEITLGQYKGLEIEKTSVKEVTDEDINAEIDRVRERNARILTVTDRPVADGDKVNLDYCGKVDDVAFEGGTAEKQELTIGSHTFIEGFEDQLIGMNIGETKDINVTFPAEYHAEELAGKPAVFTVTINGIETKELPAVDDEFAKDVSDFSTLDEYKADIAKTIGERYAKDAERQDENKLIEKVVEGTVIDIPEEMIEDQIDRYIEEFKYQLSYQGLDIDSYFKYTGTTMEQLRKDHHERAVKSVHTRLVFEEIVKAEKITASDEAIDARIKDYAENVGANYDDFVKQLTPQDRYYFENQAITEELLAFLKRENTIK